MNVSYKFLLSLLIFVALGMTKVNAENVTLDVSPFTQTSTVDSNIIYELTIQQLEVDGSVTLLKDEDDKRDANYTASVRLAKGPGGFVGNLRIKDVRADSEKSMYVVLPDGDDSASAYAITRSITKEISVYESKRAIEKAEAEKAKEPAETVKEEDEEESASSETPETEE